MIEPLCPCGDIADPDDADGLCQFCRFWNGPDAHGPWDVLTLEEASQELAKQTQ